MNPDPSRPPVRERDRLWYNTVDDRPSLSQELKPSSNLSMEDLIKSLGCANNSEFRRLAAELLGQRGAAAAPAISALLIAGIDNDATVRKAALTALEMIDPGWTQNLEVKKALPKLMEVFKHSYCFIKAYSEEMSQAAYKLLQQIGEPAVSSIANLIVEEGDKVEYKIRAIWLLRDIGSGAASAIPQLTQALSDKASKVRITAAEVLAEFGTASKVATPELIAGFTDRDGDVRKAMTLCLVATKPAVPDLLPLLVDKNTHVRESTSSALVQMGLQALPILIDTVSQWCNKPKANINNAKPSQEITEAVLQVLGKFGSNASTSMPTIALALLDPNPNIKFAAVRALGKIDRNWGSNQVVLNAISNLTNAESTVSKLIVGLDNLYDLDCIDVKAMVACLAQFGAAATPAVPTLLQLLKNWRFNPSIREAVINALGQIGVGAKAAIPALTEMLNNNDEHPLVRNATVIALQKIRKIDGQSEQKTMGFRW
jgi:HEAT repeat protein